MTKWANLVDLENYFRTSVCVGSRLHARRALHRRPGFLRRGPQVRWSAANFADLVPKIAKFCKLLAGSFSAVSKGSFARKYAFDSIFQTPQDLHTFAPLQSQIVLEKTIWKFSNDYVRGNSTTCWLICKICKQCCRNSLSKFTAR